MLYFYLFPLRASSEEDLLKLFGKFGEVEDVSVSLYTSHDMRLKTSAVVRLGRKYINKFIIQPSTSE